MKVSRKLHKGAAVAAAILALVFFLLGVITSMRVMIMNFRTGNPQLIMSTLLPQIVNLIVVIITAVALLRGRKDVLGGILFLVCALVELIRNFRTARTIFSMVRMSMDPVLGRILGNSVVNVIATLVLIVFYLLIALECFKPGAISGGGAKVMLFILPVVAALLIMIGTLILQGEVMQIGGPAMLMTLSTMLAMVVKLIPLLLTGVAFAIPVYEQPQVEQVNYTQTYTNA